MVHAKTADQIWNNVEAHFDDTAVHVSRRIPAWSGKVVSELCHYCRRNVRKWQGRADEWSGECASEAGRLIFVPLSLFAMERTRNIFWHRFEVKRKLFR